jgi:hypothetical protein
MSADPDYQAATRRGTDPDGLAAATGITLRAAERCRIVLHPTPAGRLPLILTGDRADFVTLVQALSHRNEPVPIPDSMGACTIGGYNNWDRVRRHRRSWEAAQPFATEAGWSEEFARLRATPEAYQDRFVILSDGPYSGVPAAEMGMEEAEWRAASLVIRRDHECAHYFTRRVFGSMRKNAIDEVLCDYAGLVSAFGRFEAAALLRFLGLEEFPAYRQGGRLQNYIGDPPLTAASFVVLQRIVERAARNLEAADRARRPGPAGATEMLMAIASLTLEELAEEDGAARLRRAAEAAPADQTSIHTAAETGQREGMRS